MQTPATLLSNPTIRPVLSKAELAQIVDIHLDSFPGFFLSFLGPRFLTLLYESIYQDEEGILLVLSSGTEIKGFVAGTLSQNSFYRRLLEKKKWAFAMATLGAVIKRPTVAPRLLRALRRPAEANEAGARASLMSIAVRPSCEGQGVGQRLVQVFCQELRKAGAQAVCLTTDRDENERTNQFYQKLGFCLHRTYLTPEGRAMNEYVLSLAEN